MARIRQYTRRFLTIPMVLVLGAAVEAAADDKRVVTVGVADNRPIVFREGPGRYTGLAVEFLELVAAHEGWHLRYLHGAWSEMLQHLENNQLDLLLGIAYSPERAKRFHLSDQTLINNWAIVYAPPEARINSFTELQDRRVALMAHSIHSIAFNQLMERFGFSYQPITVGDYHSVIRAIDNGEADAGIVNRIFSALDGRIHRHDGAATPIIFNPVEVRYASPRTRGRGLLQTIDLHLLKQKAHRDSSYYRLLSKWLHTTNPRPTSAWISWGLPTTGGLLLIAVIASLALRKRLHQRTKALHSSKEQYRQLLDLAQEGIWVIDRDDVTTFVNPAMAKMLGYQDQELLGRNVRSFMDEQGVKRFEESLQRRLEGLSEQLDFVFVHKDGRQIHTVIAASGITNEAGEYMGAIAGVMDITDRQESEVALRDSEERYRSLIDGSIEGILIHTSLRPLFVNRSFAVMLGYEAPEEILEMESLVPHIAAHDRNRVVAYANGENTPRQYEFDAVRRDGSVISLQSLGHEIIWMGRPATQNTVIDVTERNRAEHNAQRHLVHLNISERIIRIGLRSASVDDMLHDVMREVLNVFACDRAWISYPCDPTAESWRIPVQRSRPEWSGALAANTRQNMSPDAADVFRHAVESLNAICYDGSSHNVPDMARRLSVQSQMTMAIRPRVDRPWLFGIHHCAEPHVYDDDEVQLFEAIGHRLAEALTSLLVMRDLRASEAEHHRLFDTMAQGLVYQDADGHIIAANPAASRILGFSREQLMDRASLKPNWRTVHEDGTDFPAEQHPSQMAMRLGKPVEGVIMGVFHPDKERYRWILVNAVPEFRRGEDRPYRVFTTFSNITQLKRSQERLRHSETGLAEAQRIGRMGGWELDLSTGRITWSKEVGRLFGENHKQFSGTLEGFYNLVHPDDRARVIEAVEDGIRHGTVYEIQHRIRLQDGVELTVRERAEIVRDQAGHAVQLVGTVQDVTEWERTQAAVRKGEERVRLLLEYTHEGIFGLDRAGLCTFANLACVRQLGFDRASQLIGKDIHALIHRHCPDSPPRQTPDCPILNSLHSGTKTNLQDEMLSRADGSTFPVEFHASPMYSKDESIGSVVTFVDASQRRAIESRLREQQTELARVTRLTTMGEMASGLAHELNQPLSAIAHYCDAGLSIVRGGGASDPGLTEVLTEAYEQAQRAGDIIRNMRQFVSKKTTSKSWVNVNELIHDTIRFMQPEGRDKGIAVRTEAANNPMELMLDKVQVQQVLVNLVRNGFEAMENGHKGTKEVLVRTRWLDDSTAQITIQDSGPGIEAGIADRLFEPYETSKYDGMGMGLPISRSIVEAHGGRLWLDTSVSHGACFHLELPKVHH